MMEKHLGNALFPFVKSSTTRNKEEIVSKLSIYVKPAVDDLHNVSKFSSKISQLEYG